MTEAPCMFCDLSGTEIFYPGQLITAIWDQFPVADGHALLIPRRHFRDWFDATSSEHMELLDAIRHAKAAIERRREPDGYNLGINMGPAAGQTIFHAHVHLIPRYRGDVPDPRGGVRHVIPWKANYLREAEPPGDGAGPWNRPPHDRPLISGGSDPLLPHLIAHLARAEAVDIAVAFMTDLGVRLLEYHLQDVLDRGGRVRLLTGDYLGFTEPDALMRLLDLEGNDLQLRVFESGNMSFHPKAYIMHERGGAGTAFVGSSNLTETALNVGIEWNYRTITSRDAEGFAAAGVAFEALFSHPNTHPLDVSWIDRYLQRRIQPAPALIGLAAEPVPPPPEPHTVQKEALAALEQTRQAGNSAGLVVLATGLGKTWLSAFDSDRPEFRRILFVAHREEILVQALRTFRAVRPHAVLGRYTGEEKVPEADALFASIQTLGQQRHLESFPRDRFDYIVMDEFHHASARTYRRLIEYFQPRFLLGLTATPERTDGGDLLALCGENLVYRCDLAEGIRRGLLCPFDYFGVPDIVHYENIPWRSNRFDEEALTEAVATQARAQNAFDQLQLHGGNRTIAFCVSKRHAHFMADFFRRSGLRTAAVHSGGESDPRARSLEQLQAGELDVLFAVDMFNEGVDLPEVDTLLMLRPTESRILWLQQFGRGLRWRPDKKLKVIDYIGNHRSFLTKPRTLLELGPGDAAIRMALEKLDSHTLELPPGCSVTYDLEAKDILRQLLRPSQADALVTYYRDFLERTGVRPAAVEAYHDGYPPEAARKSYGSWLRFVRSMAGLTQDEAEVLERHGAFLDALETTEMSKSYKMLVLLAMLAEDAFPGRIEIDRLTSAFAAIAQRTPMLRAELGSRLNDPKELRSLIRSYPLSVLAEGKGTGNVAYFTLDDTYFETNFAVVEGLRLPLQGLVRELADWRLAAYLQRDIVKAQAESPANPVSAVRWQRYKREQIPPLFGLAFNEAIWRSGFVAAPGHLFLLVTLEKGHMQEAHRYKDMFVSPDEFQWQSQNRTTQASHHGKLISRHKELVTAVHLFVRRDKLLDGKAAPFLYCGEMDFIRWEGQQPITVWWHLQDPVPERLRAGLVTQSKK